MRAFIVLCLVAVTCADNLGYNYQPVGHSDSGLSFNPGHVSHGAGGFNPGLSGHVSHGVGGSYGGGPSHGVVGGSGYEGQVGSLGAGVFNNVFNGGSSQGNSGAGGSYGGSPGVGSSRSFNGDSSYAPQVELEKEFYTFTAPENEFSVPHIENQVANSAKKSLRVIFIKGPENNGVENAAIALAKHIAEQKTAIYVLQKQTDLGSLTNKLNTINSNVNHKPEVHFVKYRTHEDAINAQKAIQSQYDNLGGVSNNYNGGEAPVLNFASKAPVASHGPQASHGSFGPSGSVASSGSGRSLGSVGSSGSVVSSGSSGSSGNVGSHGSSGLSSPSSNYIPPSAPSSIYLPA